MLKRFAITLLSFLLATSISFAQSPSTNAEPPKYSEDTHRDDIYPAESRHLSGAGC